MLFIQRIYRTLISWYGKTVVLSVMGAVVVLGAAGVFLHLSGNSDGAVASTNAETTVTTARAGDMSAIGSSYSVLGTVASTKEARLTTEAGGRIVSVPVRLGQQVAAGTVIATLDNGRERAQVLQAQGVYDAAVASKESSSVGVDRAAQSVESARLAASNLYQASFTTTDVVTRDTVDLFFSNPDTRPGMLITGSGKAVMINQMRVDVGTMLETWKQDSMSPGGDVDAYINRAERNVRQVSELLLTLSEVYKDADNIRAELVGLDANISGARTQLDQVLSSLSTIKSNYQAAENALTQAKIAGSSSSASLADAQVTQALGALRLAQAGLEKTIVRSPISGTVQSLTVKESTTVSPGTPAAIVSNEGALEVVAYVTDSDAKNIEIGNGVQIGTDTHGVVTAIAGAVDPITKKIEVRVGVQDAVSTLTNGQSVPVYFTVGSGELTSEQKLVVPIIALKMTANGPQVFSVSDDNTLIAHPVVLGAVYGSAVEIKEGLLAEEFIVTDARGLREGESVVISL